MPTVVDTVVAHYFLVVREFELLLDLLDTPVVVSRIVYDPEDDPRLPETSVSEITANIRYERRLARDPETPADVREERIANVENIRAVRGYVEAGHIEVVDMTDQELNLFSRLTTRSPAPSLGLLLPLGAGEAASVAIAVERNYVLATDDGDALRVLEALRPGHPYERIRRLLVRAAEEERITPERANELHIRMQEHGFWDLGTPFPEP
jgi:hypothetical protein